MKKKEAIIYFKGIALGVLVFFLLQIISIPFGFLFKNLALIGTLLTVTLLASGFVTGRIVGKNGFLFGFLTGVSTYLFTIILASIFIATMSIHYSNGINRDNFIFLFGLSKYLFGISLVSSLITGLGGIIGSYKPHSK